MTDFIDLYLDPLVPGWPCSSGPRFSTTINQVASGDESRNKNWTHPLRKFVMPKAIREQPVYEAVAEHWLIMDGPANTFPLRDPLDFATIGLDFPNIEPLWTGGDQQFGTGDGLQRTFQLTKTYERGGFTYVRPIYLPVTDNYLILIDGDLPADAFGGPYTASVTRPGGVVTFTPAPLAGLTLTWGGLFDVLARFEGDDSFEGIVQSYAVAGFADLTFVETRLC